ncbi:MAG TPA: hypothetical protein VFV10_12555 [Gammaproteobacteria bacterium]|nr:hypothetical protein [Gammaproteobacteria bacterium]
MLETEINQVGMVTSVGRDAGTTLTSILCGVSRPKEIGYFAVTDPEFQEPEGVTGHPIEALTEGFHLYGLWIRACIACLEDLLRRTSPAMPRGAEEWGSTALIAVTPDIRSERFMSDGDETAGSLREPFLHKIAAWLGIPRTPEHLHAVCMGRTGVFTALKAASAMLERRAFDRVLVLAVDSLLDTLTLEWLASRHRLKSPSAPAGLMPGEAASAMLIEPRRGGAHSGARGLGVAVRAATQESAADQEGLTTADRGRRLARVMSGCLPSLRDPAGAGCVLISDQNGEQWRAEEFGYCGLALGSAWPSRAAVLLPAVSVGDTGAASGALACCLSAMVLSSGLVEARDGIVLGSSFDGRAGAAMLSVGD